MVKLEHILKTITYLFAATAWASVAGALDAFYSLAFSAMGVLSIYLDCRPSRRIPGWMLTVASVLILVHSLFRINANYFIEPILDALVILMAIKLLNEKKYRDYMQVYMLGIFILLGSGLVSLSVVFLPYLFIMLAFSTMSLILLAHLSENPDMNISAKHVTLILQHALIICSIAIPASAFFFIILPRANYPLFNFLGKGWAGVSGFSDKVDLGDLAEIQEDGNAIFRVEMDRVEESNLYWRGVVLDRFDGTSWESASRWSYSQPVPLNGPQIQQTVFLEPYGHRYLFALDKPLSISLRNADRSNALTFSMNTHVYNRLHYRAVSVISAILPEGSIDLNKYLHLPEGYSPRIQQLVGQLTGTADEQVTISALFKFISRGSYKYSLKNLPVSDAPLEEFLFRQKEGNCEYFASALGVMLRMAKIPTRLVGGYKGGYYNSAGGYYLVLQKNAHVWVEAYRNGQGWIRLDPTPYTMENPGLAYANSFLINLKLVMDTFNYYWNKFVITYDFSRQLAIVNALRSTVARSNLTFDLHKVDPRSLAPVAAIVLACVFGVMAARATRRARNERILAAFLRRMAKLGYTKARCQGLEEFLSKIVEEDLKRRAAVFVAEYQNLYYTDRPFTSEDAIRLRNCIKEL